MKIAIAEEISEDSHFQREDGLLGRNREAAAKLNTPRAPGDEVQNEEDQGIKKYCSPRLVIVTYNTKYPYRQFIMSRMGTLLSLRLIAF